MSVPGNFLSKNLSVGLQLQRFKKRMIIRWEGGRRMWMRRKYYLDGGDGGGKQRSALKPPGPR